MGQPHYIFDLSYTVEDVIIKTISIDTQDEKANPVSFKKIIRKTGNNRNIMSKDGFGKYYVLNFNEEGLKLYNSYERKDRDYVIVRIKDIDSLKRKWIKR